MANNPGILTSPSQPPTDLQNLTLFRIYVVYRSVLSILLLLSLLSADTRLLLGILNAQLYFYVSLAYLATNLVLLFLMTTRFYGSQAVLFAVFFVDILAISLLSDASGGMGSGLPILLIITAAASAILINSSSIATLIAALCVIAVLADTIRLVNEQILGINSLLQAGLLGILIFAVSILIQIVARRVGKAEALAHRRAADLYNLQRLNEQIVQHMQIGILLVYANGSVRVMNQAATRLLDPDRPVPLEQGRKLSDYHSGLSAQFDDWRKTGQQAPRPLQIRDDSPQIIANFRSLTDSSDGDSLVFVEDYSPVTQYAQSLKLASLGRLTASIAHEIRNPLGAVSHAAQLLGESSELSAPDQRLADIIQQHTRRMNVIIESVMQISRRRAAQPQLLQLNNWMRNFLRDYAATINVENAIELTEQEPDIKVSFDPENLQRVLSNLLDNALRHSEPSTTQPRAVLALGVDHMAQRCLIDIVDYGVGVPLAEQAKLFEPFYTTVDKGTGLGLYLCKELCEINKATLVYRPTADGQSCFRIAVSYHH